MLFILQILLLLSCGNKADDTIILIPEGYVGPVLVIYNQDNGAEKEYEDGKRVYRIPENGVLETQFSPNYGVQNNEYYYVSSNGNKKKLDFVRPADAREYEPRLSEVVIFGIETVGNSERYDPDTKELLYKTPPGLTFYVGTIDQEEKAHKVKQDFVFNHMKKLTKQ